MHFRALKLFAMLCLALGLGTSLVAQQAQPIAGGNPALPLVHVDNGENSAAAQKAHYVVLVSLDGFRWDYAKHDGAVNLLALARRGVWAPEGMMPSYPSLTFPNHFTIVTGLYPEHHGLVANSFYDETKHARYAISDAKAVRTEAGTAACRCGAWRRARECARLACSGQVRRQRSQGIAPRGMQFSITRRRPLTR